MRGTIFQVGSRHLNSNSDMSPVGACVILLRMFEESHDSHEVTLPSDDIRSLPIGVFDSGVGGLTVMREIIRQLPGESIYYFGDTLRCPYGSRPLDEIKTFARQVSAWLIDKRVKMIVVACNSATAAALEIIRQETRVPIIGVVVPGARAAARTTRTLRVGVIGTAATVNSDIYRRAIRSIDPRITVFSKATPRFVDIVEQGLRVDHDPIEEISAGAASAYLRPAFLDITRDYLDPFKSADVDTLVLGCTHFPLLIPLISQIMGSDVRIISSAEETARDVAEVLATHGTAAADATVPRHRFATTARNIKEFAEMGSSILALPIQDIEQVGVEELEVALEQARRTATCDDPNRKGE